MFALTTMAVSCNLVAMSSVAYTCIVDVQGVLPEHVHEYVCRNAEILDYLNPRTVCWQLVIYISVQLVGCVVWYDAATNVAMWGVFVVVGLIPIVAWTRLLGRSGHIRGITWKMGDVSTSFIHIPLLQPVVSALGLNTEYRYDDDFVRRWRERVNDDIDVALRDLFPRPKARRGRQD